MKRGDLSLVARAIAMVLPTAVKKAVRDEVPAVVEQQLKSIPPPKDGVDGKSFSLDDARPVIEEAVREAVAALPVPKDGESVTVEQVLPPVLEAMRAAVAELPPAKDGDSVSLASVVMAVMPSLRDELQSAVEALPAPRDGASVTAEEVLPELRAQVDTFLKALPVPRDGVSVTVEEVVQALLPGVEKTLGSLHDRWALDFERRAQDTLQRACDRIPKPQDGKDGRDGADALSVGEFAAEVAEDGRTVVLSLGAGEQRKQAQLHFPVMLDRGVFKEGTEYQRGDAVTWAGSLWIAQKDAPEGKPEISRDWRLAVKRGRDGKQGDPGRDLRDPKPVKAG